MIPSSDLILSLSTYILFLHSFYYSNHLIIYLVVNLTNGTRKKLVKVTEQVCFSEFNHCHSNRVLVYIFCCHPTCCINMHKWLFIVDWTFCQFKLTLFILVKHFPLNSSLSAINLPHVHYFCILWSHYCPPLFKKCIMSNVVCDVSFQSSIYLDLISLINLSIKGEFSQFTIILRSDAFDFLLCLVILIILHFLDVCFHSIVMWDLSVCYWL